MKVNIACGTMYINSREWCNLDYDPASSTIHKADLLKSLPLRENAAEVVYSSHFVEHIPRPLVKPFLSECYRILQPGGMIRLVLPDFEEMARTYLTLRSTGDHVKADFLITEIIDQCVRRQPGGELGRLWRAIQEDPMTDVQFRVFIQERMGAGLKPDKVIISTQTYWVKLLSSLCRRMRHMVQQCWIRTVLAATPSAFRLQNVSFAGIGELHHWLWDFYQIRQELEAAGFIQVERSSANTSIIPDFPCYPLDINSDGYARKGAESMFIEARKHG